MPPYVANYISMTPPPFNRFSKTCQALGNLEIAATLTKQSDKPVEK
jgi:hypothetical protein